MEKDRKRAERRPHADRVAHKRAKYYERWLDVSPDQYGRLRWNHFGCGCWMCKPYKYSKSLKYRVSERRRLQDEE